MSLVDFHGYPTLEARNVFRYELEQLASDLKKAMPESKWNEFIKVVSDAVRVCGGPTSAGVGTMLEYCAHARGASSYRDDLVLFAAWLRSETEKAKDKATPVTDSEEEEAAYIQEKRKKSKETDIAIALCDLQNPHPPQNSRVTTVN